MQKSIMFFISMLPVFFARVRPASQSAKPACMKNTRIEPTRTQITSVAEYIQPFHDLSDKKRRNMGMFYISLMHLIVLERVIIKKKRLGYSPKRPCLYLCFTIFHLSLSSADMLLSKNNPVFSVPEADRHGWGYMKVSGESRVP